MEAIFTKLGQALAGAPWLALAASLAWGVLSVVLSPCHLASIPLIVAFISGQGETSTGRAFRLSLLFASGILATIAGIGLATATAGRMAGDIGRWGNYAVALVFLIVGLHLLGLIPLPVRAASPSGWKRKGYGGALLLGLVFGLALGPCTFAFMAPLLGVVFKLGASRWALAALLLLAYGLGHCGVIVAAGSATARVQRFLDWNEQSKGLAVLKGICGLLVLAAGFWMIQVAR